MTGSDIIGALLRASAPLVAKVPIDRIKAELLPEGAPLPALLVRLVSSVERQPLKRAATTRTTDRVAVLVRAANERERALLLKLVVEVCAGKTGNIGGASSVSILTAGAGPGVIGPGGSFERTQDFRVSFDA